MSFAASCSSRVIKKAQQGDKFALVQIYHLYKTPVYNLAYRMLNDSDLAADVLQMVFLKMMQNIQALSENNKIGPWLKRITYNLIIDTIRKRQKEVLLEENVIEFIEYDNAVKVVQSEYFDVEKYLATLSERERLIIYLFVIEGYNHSEIAIELEITESNSKQIYRRSLKKLLTTAKLTHYSGESKEKHHEK